MNIFLHKSVIAKVTSAKSFSDATRVLQSEIDKGGTIRLDVNTLSKIVHLISADDFLLLPHFNDYATFRLEA